GINRIQSMLESRPDWCISRQRSWGVPITAFYCETCDEAKADASVFEHLANEIQSRGVDIWFTEPVEKLIPKNSKCGKCSGTKFRKEKDILDVWFDSGVSHAAVCEERELGWPAELYLEGSDQHRGWFQASLLTAVATRHRAPFKTVLTHGFVNDAQGKKMSKSKGNVTSPLEIMKTHGGDILRFWVVLEDYRNDLNFSKESLERVSESYRKIRNTVRFLLGNLNDFDPQKDSVGAPQMGDLDLWALSRAATVLETVAKAYENYEFHIVYQQVINFCVVDLSAIYFDILKDRLYTAGKKSFERRSSQTALYLISSALVRALAPILSFTAEEAWAILPGNKESVFLSEFPSGEHGLKKWQNPELENRFAGVWAIRDVVLKALEGARQDKTIGHPREAKVTLTVDGAGATALKSVREDPARTFLVSVLEIVPGKAVAAQVSVAQGEKCARCWTYSITVGKQKGAEDLCSRCAEALGETG
ncbi:MAG: class I tRNA ligase family protein, partial [Bdellovibrionota bacterium]